MKDIHEYWEVSATIGEIKELAKIAEEHKLADDMIVKLQKASFQKNLIMVCPKKRLRKYCDVYVTGKN